jgi:TetR/AcrR family transcriptional regulator
MGECSKLLFTQSIPILLNTPLLKVLERGIKEGCFRSVDPFLTLTHIISVCIFYFVVQ